MTVFRNSFYENLDIQEVFHVLFEQIFKSPSYIYFLLYFVIYINQSDLKEFIKTLALSFGRWLETVSLKMGSQILKMLSETKCSESFSNDFSLRDEASLL